MARAAAILLCLLAGCRTEKDVQRDIAGSMRPAEIDSGRAQASQVPLNIMRARIWADAEYRAQTPRWEQHIRDQIDRANQVLEGDLRVRLSIVSIKEWQRPSRQMGGQLDEAMQELHEHDSAPGADWIIGFVSANTVFTATLEQLGQADLFGRYLVLRGMFSLAEFENLRTTLDKLPAEESEGLARERRMHKETAVLLHELGHTLGGFHEASERSLMAPIYDAQQSGFDPVMVELLLLGVQHRDDVTAAGRAAWLDGYRDAAKRIEPWEPKMREEALALAEAYLAPQGAHREQLQLDAPPEAPDAGTRAAELDGGSRDAGVAPKLDEKPAGGAPLSQSDTASLAQIKAAAQGDANTRIAALLKLEAELHRGAESAEVWNALAQALLETHSCTAAERAEAMGERVSKWHASASKKVRSDCALLRRKVSLRPRVLWVSEEHEHDYIDGMLTARAELDRGDFNSALSRAEALQKQFPGSPAKPILNCLVRTQQGKRGPAHEACASAAAAAPQSFAPRYLLGLLEAASQHWPEAEAQLRRALAIDDTPYDAWASLAAVLAQRREMAALETLQRDHQKRFGEKLVPAMFPAGWKL